MDEVRPELRLEELLRVADRGGKLSFDQTRELAGLYRKLSARLSRARQRAHDPEALRYLNALCVRAYTHVHQDPPRARRGRWFWLRELPRALSRTLSLQLFAWVILLGGAFVGQRAVQRDPEAIGALVPAAMYPAQALDTLLSSEEARQDFLERREVAVGENAVFGASLFSNNTRVGILSFAVGPLLGLPTVLLLLYNGLTLGAFSAIFLGTSHTLVFLAWIIPHGIPELLAIVLCATGGLAMARAVLAPERIGRAASLRGAASDALALVLASLPLFVLAALIESFIRQSTLSTATRFTVAAVVLAALAAYVVAVAQLARRAARERVDTRFLG